MPAAPDRIRSTRASPRARIGTSTAARPRQPVSNPSSALPKTTPAFANEAVTPRRSRPPHPPRPNQRRRLQKRRYRPDDVDPLDLLQLAYLLDRDISLAGDDALR